MLLAQRTSLPSFPHGETRRARRDARVGTEQSQSHAPYTLIRAAGSPKRARSFVHILLFTRRLFLRSSLFFSLLFLPFYFVLSLFFSQLYGLTDFLGQVAHGGGGEPRLWQFVANLTNGSGVVIVVAALIGEFKVRFVAGSTEDG